MVDKEKQMLANLLNTDLLDTEELGVGSGSRSIRAATLLIVKG